MWHLQGGKVSYSLTFCIRWSSFHSLHLAQDLAFVHG